MPKSSISGFNGLSIAAFESRMLEETRMLIAKHHGVARCAPSMQEIPLDHNPEAYAFAESLLNKEIDIVIFMTGVGTELLFKALSKRYEVSKIVTALASTVTVARGPKPVSIMRKHGILIMIQVPEPNTSKEILEALDNDEKSLALTGKKIAIQEYGAPSKGLIEGLKKRGAKVMQVPVYRWALPDDTKPLSDLIREIIKGSADIAMFTSAQQIRNLFKLSSELGLEHELKESLKKSLIASIGPTCSEAIRETGLNVDFEPSRPKLAIMIAELSENADGIINDKKEGRITRSFKQEIDDLSAMKKAIDNSVFMKACRREETHYTPVWIMRQAGRYMADYRRVRNRVTFLELCKTKELVAEVTITAQEKLGTDAAIIFSDILLLVEPLGLGLEYESGVGPQISGSLSSEKDIRNIPEVDPSHDLGYVADAIRLTRANLKPDIPLLGFSAAPFTLASYILEGGASKNFIKTKSFMYSSPELWNLLLGKLTRMLSLHLKAQADAGANALQIFDSWAGVLSPEDYLRYAYPFSKELIASLDGTVPTIHFGTGTGPFLETFADAGSDVVGIDYKIDLNKAWDRIGNKRAIQGNIDPVLLYAPVNVIREKVKSLLDSVQGRKGHIFNLGHGILPTTPEHNAIALVDMVHELSLR